MRTRLLKLASVLAVVVATASAPLSARIASPALVGPALSSIGSLAFGSDGMLLAADTNAATIFAINLGAAATKGVAGTKDIAGIDQKIAAMLGTAANEIAIKDLAVHPKTHNAYLSVMRGTGANSQPVLLRVDGAGTIEVVATDALTFTSVTLPNPANVSPNGRGGRAESITDLAFSDGRVFVAGLSNEEFASKLWSVPYPFVKADNGTSVEIFHGNHGGLETRSPVYTFVPYKLAGASYIIGGYLCTPLVKFPVSSLAPGAKVQGTTIGEFGAGNRPLDMIVYSKGGQEFLLMSNSARGVMKVSTAPFATAGAITAPVKTPTAGVPYETIASMTGIEQLDLLDADHSIVIVNASGARNLSAVILP